MASRPVFVPKQDGTQLLEEVEVAFNWHPGMSPTQKKKNVRALHDAAARRSISPLLEVSTKSEEKLGQRLSAFNLKINTDVTEMAFESAYQGSKVFTHGGPYVDLYYKEPREAKRDPRLRESGTLERFEFDGKIFPLIPKTAFYDWLYIQAIYPYREFLKRLHEYGGFTDIEFNPERSLNTQARACAVFVALDLRGLLEDCANSFDIFCEVLEKGLPDTPLPNDQKTFLPSDAVVENYSEDNSAKTAVERMTVPKTLPASHPLNVISIYDAGINQSKLAIGLAEIFMNWGSIEFEAFRMLKNLNLPSEDHLAEDFFLTRGTELRIDLLRTAISSQTISTDHAITERLSRAFESLIKIGAQRNLLAHGQWRPAPDGFAVTPLPINSSAPSNNKAEIKVNIIYVRNLLDQIKELYRIFLQLSNDVICEPEAKKSQQT
jgi:hypothetical protein